MSNNRIAIGYVHPEHVNALFHHSLVVTLNDDWKGSQRIKGRTVPVMSGPMIDQARNDIVREFLVHKDQPDWLLMVDTDMVWTPEALKKVFAAAHPTDAPIVGGLCFAALNDEVWPVMLVKKDEKMCRVLDYPRDTVCAVDATGAAFMLIHRSVFEKMRETMGPKHPAPWFAFSYYPDGQPCGEDVTFCIRARSMGLPIYVHTGARIIHRKAKGYSEGDYDRTIARARFLAREEDAEALEAKLAGEAV